MLPMLQFLSVLCLSLHVFANTEIVNFHVSESHNEELSFTNSWPRLNSTHSEREWTVLPAPFGTPLQEVCNIRVVDNPCPHQLWLVLDLTRDWSTYSSFTLRLSWPASYPVEFSLEIFNPESLSAQFGPRLGFRNNSLTTHAPLLASNTRLRYARIRLVDIGILTPSPMSRAAKPTSPTPVPFILALEPLYFGVLPPSIVPVLAYIFSASIMACIIVPPLIKYLDGIASQARKELLWDGNRKYN